MGRLAIGLLCGFAFTLSSCGTTVPKMVLSNQPHATAFFINKLVNHVKCEVREAFFRAREFDLKNAKEQGDGVRRLAWLDTWAAELSLTLTVKETGAIAPSLDYTDELGKVSTLVLNTGISSSSEATRIAKIDFTLPFADFLKERQANPKRPIICKETGGILVNGDLGFDDMIDDLAFPHFIPGNVAIKPPKTFSNEVQFMVAVSGNVNPAFDLRRVDTNPPGTPSLFSASRARTNDIVVSLGPTVPGKPDTPSQQLEAAHQNALLRSAFQNALTTAP
ncbi:hypothetical protein [Rhizobium leguminosarum]|uniref:hypothetical protein n=1 Tax=Rhizobium leguminosarum TaxID=384 RepID=UPI001C92AF84|nr:hypothetical protein [Rhizobium leguminosarum]MBY2985681.1 hypothetical protein [Rhizobium leguminosarum]